MITLRLDPELERKIIFTAKRLGISKSELIRKSISNYLQNISFLYHKIKISIGSKN